MELVAFPILIFCLLIPLMLALIGFWIWMLVDCAQNDSFQGNDKIVWILLLVFLGWIGALIYFFVQRPKRFQKPPVLPPFRTPPPLP